MKSIIFDTGPIISIVTNNLLWVLEELKKRYDGEFYITPAVKKEVIDKPLRSKMFKLEALQLMSFISKGIIKVYEPENKQDFNDYSKWLLDLANKIFMCRDFNIKIVHIAEIEALALAKMINADAFVVDERNIRVLVEDPGMLSILLSKKLHRPVDLNKKFMNDFLKEITDVNVIRSIELMTTAYSYGILDNYIVEDKLSKGINFKKNLLEGILWGLKLRGCAISQKEIKEIMKIEGF